MKHTPGPWGDSGPCGQKFVRGLQVIIHKGEGAVAYVDGKANARRIVHCVNTYDDLLEALKNIENDAGQIPDHAWQVIQDAIAKAEGTDT